MKSKDRDLANIYFITGLDMHFLTRITSNVQIILLPTVDAKTLDVREKGHLRTSRMVKQNLY